MATYVKFNDFVEDLCNEVHDLIGTGGTGADVLNVYLSNTAPDVSLDGQKSDLAEIAFGNGYTAPVDTTNVGAASAGTVTVQGDSITITASGGAIAEFQYVVLYNDTATNDELIAYWDYGGKVNLADGESFTVKFSNQAATGTIFTLA